MAAMISRPESFTPDGAIASGIPFGGAALLLAAASDQLDVSISDMRAPAGGAPAFRFTAGVRRVAGVGKSIGVLRGRYLRGRRHAPHGIISAIDHSGGGR